MPLQCGSVAVADAGVLADGVGLAGALGREVADGRGVADAGGDALAKAVGSTRAPGLGEMVGDGPPHPARTAAPSVTAPNTIHPNERGCRSATMAEP